jgi:hypothetical protein
MDVINDLSEMCPGIHEARHPAIADGASDSTPGRDSRTSKGNNSAMDSKRSGSADSLFHKPVAIELRIMKYGSYFVGIAIGMMLAIRVAAAFGAWLALS